MKKNFRPLLSIVIALSVLISFMFPTFGASSAEYSNILSNALKADGSYAEQAAHSLGQIFENGPIAFLNAAAGLADDQQDRIAYLLAYNANYKDIDTFKEKVNKLKSSNQLSNSSVKCIDKLLKAIEKLKSDYTNNPGTDTVDIAAPKFDTDTIMTLINGHKNLQNENIDEEYAEVIANAFRADPKLFSKTISNLADEDINKVIKSVAHDCAKKDKKQVDTSESSVKLSDKESKVLDRLVKEINNTTVQKPSSDISTLKVNNESTSAAPAAMVGTLSTQVPSIGAMSYTSTPLVTGETETLNVTFNESSTIYSTRSYYADIYVVKDGVSSYRTGKAFSIAAGYSYTSVNFGFTFPGTGAYYTLVKVYTGAGGTLLAQRQGAYADYVYGAPTIGTISYTTTPLKVGETETLNVSFTENTTQVARSYYVEIYNIKNGTSYLKTSKTISIGAGASSADISFSMSFSSPGAIYTLVKVYSKSGGVLLTQRQGSASDNVYGYWKINVSLPTNRNNKGKLSLYKADGSLVNSFECLGRSASNDSMTITNGNTPTGTYTGYLDGPYSPTSSYGPYKVVNMTGVSGVIAESGRSGIWIHGGDPETNTSATWYPLRPTHGCVRISNTNQQTLQDSITTLTSSVNCHYNTGNIYITES